nr:IS66 family transposase [Sorangium cellulosum]
MTEPPAPPAKLPVDIEDVRLKLEQLAAEGRIADLIELVVQLLVGQRDTNTALSVRLANALRELYGRKSQKVSSEQLSLMLAALGDAEQKGGEPAPAPSNEAAATEPGDGPVPQPPDPPKPPRGRGGRAPLPRDLPREERVIQVPEAERACGHCGETKQCIGYRTSEVLDFVPAQFRIIEEKREKLACPACPEEGVVTAASEKVMDRGRPGPGLLAHILVHKYHDSTPLYRQTQQYERSGVSLSPSTLGDWAAFGVDVLTPVADRIFERVVDAFYLHVDDTGLRVLDRDHPNGVKRGHVWSFAAQVDDAHILVHEYHDSTPLYRQTQQYERSGVSLSPSTLGDWAAFGVDVLTPVADRIFERVVDAFYLHVDDTGLRVLDRDHPNGVKRGHVWSFAAQVDDGTKLVAFRYAPDWSSKRPAVMLAGFCGYMQGDGYAGYDAMEDEDGAPVVTDERRLGCGMHIRAKFEKAAKSGDARAAIALSYFKTIYRVEAACKAEGLGPDARKERRDEQSLGAVDELYRWIRELHPRLVPKTPLYEATRYALGQEAAWRRCFTDGRFEIDNGEAERSLRRISIGRKNYLFAGSDKGAERLARAYTVFGSCQLNGIDPLAWATDVIGKLQAGWPLSRLDELLPDAWGKSPATDA